MLSILDIVAGTGRYSIALSEQGYDVTAIELLECNVEKMKKKKAMSNYIKEMQCV